MGDEDEDEVEDDELKDLHETETEGETSHDVQDDLTLHNSMGSGIISHQQQSVAEKGFSTASSRRGLENIASILSISLAPKKLDPCEVFFVNSKELRNNTSCSLDGEQKSIHFLIH